MRFDHVARFIENPNHGIVVNGYKTSARQLPADKKQNAEDNVNGEKLDAFDPVGLAVAADLKQDVNRSDYGEYFRPRKLEIPSAYQTNVERRGRHFAAEVVHVEHQLLNDLGGNPLAAKAK